MKRDIVPVVAPAAWELVDDTNNLSSFSAEDLTRMQGFDAVPVRIYTESPPCVDFAVPLKRRLV